MKRLLLTIFLLSLLLLNTVIGNAQEETVPKSPDNLDYSEYTIFDDRMYLNGYAQKYDKLPKETIVAMIQDETISAYKTAAAVRVFNKNFATEIVGKEKKRTEKTLLRRLNRTDSAFVQVEIMHALLRIDRYKYFKSMVPALIKKMNHYNDAVNDIAFHGLVDVTESDNGRSREARIVFNTLRKILFLTRKRLADIKEPDERLAQKLKLLRWSIKILGTQELKKLPKEVINLL